MDKRFERPISPHLSVYRMQISSALSIMHRVSGFFLFWGLLLLLWWLIYCFYWYGFTPSKSFCVAGFVLEMRGDPILKVFSSVFGNVILALWSYCLFYHAFAGVRHLCWDLGIGFGLKHMAISGQFVVGFSLCVWGITWFYLLLA
jgi:succinate dehydrogenase / fumarate reductase, cytochrome b subunit